MAGVVFALEDSVIEGESEMGRRRGSRSFGLGLLAALFLAGLGVVAGVAWRGGSDHGSSDPREVERAPAAGPSSSVPSGMPIRREAPASGAPGGGESEVVAMVVWVRANDRPVPEARLWWSASLETLGQGGATTTDEEGRARIVAPDPEGWLLVVTPRHRPWLERTILQPETEVELWPLRAHRVLVRDLHHAPIAGAEVQATGPWDAEMRELLAKVDGAGAPSPSRARTDQGGEATIWVDPRVDSRLEAHAPGFLPPEEHVLRRGEAGTTTIRMATVLVAGYRVADEYRARSDMGLYAFSPGLYSVQDSTYPLQRFAAGIPPGLSRVPKSVVEGWKRTLGERLGLDPGTVTWFLAAQTEMASAVPEHTVPLTWGLPFAESSEDGSRAELVYRPFADFGEEDLLTLPDGEVDLPPPGTVELAFEGLDPGFAREIEKHQRWTVHRRGGNELRLPLSAAMRAPEEEKESSDSVRYRLRLWPGDYYVSSADPGDAWHCFDFEEFRVYRDGTTRISIRPDLGGLRRWRMRVADDRGREYRWYGGYLRAAGEIFPLRSEGVADGGPRISVLGPHEVCIAAIPGLGERTWTHRFEVQEGAGVQEVEVLIDVPLHESAISNEGRADGAR